MAMMTKSHTFTMVGSDTQSHEHGFTKAGRVLGVYVYGLTSQATDVRLYKGEFLFADGFPMESLGGATKGYRIPLEDGIPVGIGDTMTIELTDRSAAGNVVRTVLTGIEGEG